MNLDQDTEEVCMFFNILNACHWCCSRSQATALQVKRHLFFLSLLNVNQVEKNVKKTLQELHIQP